MLCIPPTPSCPSLQSCRWAIVPPCWCCLLQVPESLQIDHSKRVFSLPVTQQSNASAILLCPISHATNLTSRNGETGQWARPLIQAIRTTDWSHCFHSSFLENAPNRSILGPKCLRKQGESNEARQVMRRSKSGGRVSDGEGEAERKGSDEWPFPCQETLPSAVWAHRPSKPTH